MRNIYNDNRGLMSKIKKVENHRRDEPVSLIMKNQEKGRRR